MAFGSIEIVSITRTQDYTTLKQNQDNKALTDQSNIMNQMQKETGKHIREVHSSDNADWQNKKFDAKEKGKNEYNGDGGEKRKKEEKQDQVIVKGHQGFDIKI